MVLRVTRDSRNNSKQQCVHHTDRGQRDFNVKSEERRRNTKTWLQFSRIATFHHTFKWIEWENLQLNFCETTFCSSGFKYSQFLLLGICTPLCWISAWKCTHEHAPSLLSEVNRFQLQIQNVVVCRYYSFWIWHPIRGPQNIGPQMFSNALLRFTLMHGNCVE